jgi:hypothetical protein
MRQFLQDPEMRCAYLPRCVCGEFIILTTATAVWLAAFWNNLHSRQPETHGRAKELSVRESNYPSPQHVGMHQGKINIKRVLTIKAENLHLQWFNSA